MIENADIIMLQTNYAIWIDVSGSTFLMPLNPSETARERFKT